MKINRWLNTRSSSVIVFNLIVSTIRCPWVLHLTEIPQRECVWCCCCFCCCYHVHWVIHVNATLHRSIHEYPPLLSKQTVTFNRIPNAMWAQWMCSWSAHTYTFLVDFLDLWSIDEHQASKQATHRSLLSVKYNINCTPQRIASSFNLN